MNFDIQKLESHTYIKVLNERLDSLISPDLKSEIVLMAGEGVNQIVLDL